MNIKTLYYFNKYKKLRPAYRGTKATSDIRQIARLHKKLIKIMYKEKHRFVFKFHLPKWVAVCK